MKLKWALSSIGLAMGLTVIILGALVIYHGLAVGLGRGIESGEYVLFPPDREAVLAGVLMIALGSISVSVSLASAMVLWKRNRQVNAIASSKDE